LKLLYVHYTEYNSTVKIETSVCTLHRILRTFKSIVKSYRNLLTWKCTYRSFNLYRTFKSIVKSYRNLLTWKCTYRSFNLYTEYYSTVKIETSVCTLHRILPYGKDWNFCMCIFMSISSCSFWLLIYRSFNLYRTFKSIVKSYRNLLTWKCTYRSFNLYHTFKSIVKSYRNLLTW
jgi:uncharacterized protein YktA (UPF0223 family)